MHATAIPLRRALPAAAAVLALGLAAAAPSANAAEPTAVTSQAAHLKAVVVLIGANDYGLVAPTTTRAAE